jgi:hypothetical protein
MTNRLLDEFSINLTALHRLQQELLAQLDDNNLQLALPGRNPKLGALLREMGDWQRQYIESLKTFRHDFSLHAAPPDAETSVEVLKSWFTELEADFRAAVEALTNDDLQKPVNRGGWSPAVSLQFHLYREMMLIYYSHLDVYVRALDKTISHQWHEWIG